MLLSWSDGAVFVGQDDGLDAVARLEFHQDVPDVGLDGGLTQDELGGDLGVGHPPGEQGEHFEFSGGEGGQLASCAAAGRTGWGGMRTR